MRLTPQAIAEFKQIYQEVYGTLLSDPQAEEMALRVLRLFEILSTPTGPLTDSDGTLA